MSEFLIQKLPYDLSSHTGLALVGKYLAHIKFDRLADRSLPVRSGVCNSAILKSYLVLLCLSKSDFYAIEAFHGDPEIRSAVEVAAHLFEQAGAHVKPMPALLTRGMLDGMDHFWRMRSFLDLQALPLEHIAFTVPWNMSEQPAASINCGHSSSGLPIGLQIAGKRFDDIGVMRVARAFEKIRGKQSHWPQ